MGSEVSAVDVGLDADKDKEEEDGEMSNAVLPFLSCAGLMGR